jgi:Ni,Fe-hydrogenase maturation factor
LNDSQAGTGRQKYVIALGNQLPEDTAFGRIVNRLKKNLVTTEQTSAY